MDLFLAVIRRGSNLCSFPSRALADRFEAYMHKTKDEN
jgi:hypothetical protein